MSFERLLGHVSDLKHEIECLHDEHISKSYHKKQMKKLKKLQESESTLLQRIDKLAHENEKYKNEIVAVTKQKDYAEAQLKSAEERIATLHRGFKERERSKTELRDENAELQNTLAETKKALDRLKQSKNLQQEYKEKKLKGMESKNGELESSLKSKDETIRNLNEELKILEYKNLELENNKKGLELEIRKRKRQFDSLSTESPEIANKICKQQGYAITSDSKKQCIIKMEPNDFCSDIKPVNNFMCRICYYFEWLQTVPKTEDLNLSANPADTIKTFSSQSELHNHFLIDHETQTFWPMDGSIYACTESDSKNGTCRFRSNSKQAYEQHLSIDHAKIQLLTKREIYELRKIFPNHK